jgi:large conductance mechanosensitive channel
MLQGFKTFIMRGNVIELAVGVIIGAAFGQVVDSMAKDLINPLLGAVVGQPDFSAVKLGPLNIGNFINAIISFLIKAAGLYFLIVLPFNNLATRFAAAAPPPSATEVLLADIRDELKKQRTK